MTAILALPLRHSRFTEEPKHTPMQVALGEGDLFDVGGLAGGTFWERFMRRIVFQWIKLTCIHVTL